MDSLSDGETIKINLTPKIPGGVTFTDSVDSVDSSSRNVYSLSFQATDIGESTECSFSVTKNISKSSIYLELQTATESEKYRLPNEQGVTKECFWAQGGNARLMKRNWVLKDEELINIDLPYVNGANFNFTISKPEVNTEL